MARRTPAVAGLALLASHVAAPLAEPAAPSTAVEVFTDSRVFPPPAPSAAVTVHDLSAGNRLLAGLSRGLPGDPQAAAAAAKARIAGSAEALRAAFAGNAKAFEYGLRKIPAIVFGHGEAVVYGAVDLAEALAAYRRWREPFGSVQERSRP